MLILEKVDCFHTSDHFWVSMFSFRASFSGQGPPKFSRRALITDVLKLDGDASVIQLNVAGCHFGVSFYHWRDFGVGWLGGDYGSINPFHNRF